MKKGIYIFILITLLAIPFQHINSDPVRFNNSFSEKAVSSDSLLLILNKLRGDIQWEKSSDCNNWIEINTLHSDTLHIGTDTLAYYRAKVTEGTCLPLYSDTILVSNSSNKKVNPQYGDTLSIINHNKDSISLIIPPYALQDTTTITILPYFSAPNNPIAKNIFPGVRILPDSLRLLKPATIRVDISSGIPDTSLSTLFFLHDSSLAYPLGNPEISDSSMQGEIYHFSSYFGGTPDGDEIAGQSDNTGNSGSSNPFDWQGTYTLVEGLLQYAQLLIYLGNTEEAQKAVEKAIKIIENDTEKFIEVPIPDNPCSWYLQALLKFSEKLNLLIDGELNEQISDRIDDVLDSCAFHEITEFHGEVEFNHYVTFAEGLIEDFEYNWDIQGSIPFSYCRLDNNTITGMGYVEHNISGHAAECELTGQGYIPVWISGELSFAQGFQWLDMTFHETMFQDYGVTYVCPGVIYVSPQPVGKPEPTVRFLMEDGYTVTIPVKTTGASGTYVYTLHLH